MRKLLLILLLIFPFQGAWAKIINYKPFLETDRGIVFETDMPNNIVIKDVQETFKSQRNNSKVWCKSKNKHAYIFYKKIGNDTWQFDDDDRGNASWKTRFFCSSNSNEAIQSFHGANEICKTKTCDIFKSELDKYGGDLFFVHSVDDFNQEMSANINLNQEPTRQYSNDDDRRIETCKKYGFKVGTEKLGDCVMKIMEIEMKQLDTHRQMEAANQAANHQRALSLQQQKLIETQQLNESIRMMQMGLEMMQPRRSAAPPPPVQHNPLAPRPSVKCFYRGNTMECY